VHATGQFVADVEMNRDGHRWFRHALGDVNRHRDGVTTLAAGLPEAMLRLALTMPTRLIGDPAQAWLSSTRDVHCRTTPLFGLIAVRNPADFVQRLHLEAARYGVAMQPLNQVMEIAERDRALGRSSEATRHLAVLIPEQHSPRDVCLSSGGGGTRPRSENDGGRDRTVAGKLGDDRVEMLHRARDDLRHEPIIAGDTVGFDDLRQVPGSGAKGDAVLFGGVDAHDRSEREELLQRQRDAVAGDDSGLFHAADACRDRRRGEAHTAPDFAEGETGVGL
jgi:hypothetical protein